MDNYLFPTTVIGSMPRPKYIKDLVESQSTGQSTQDFHRIIEKAVPYIIQMQDFAGIDILSDGEWRRKSYIGIIADICSGFDLNIRDVDGERQTWHTVTSKTKVHNPGQFAREAAFLKSHTNRQIKVALPSPYLIGERMWDQNQSSSAYPTKRDFIESLIPILRAELIALRDEGATIAQFDDPHLCLFVDPKVRAQFEEGDSEAAYIVDALNRITDGIDGIKLALHLCRRNKGRLGWVGEGGYAPILSVLNDLQFDIIMFEFAIPVAGDKRVLIDLSERFKIGLGCVDCRNSHIDTPEEIAARVRQALKYVAPERIILHPDCGFAPGSAADIPIDEAYQKLKNEVLAAEILRSEYR